MTHDCDVRLSNKHNSLTKVDVLTASYRFVIHAEPL